jgi:hypothetical protein
MTFDSKGELIRKRETQSPEMQWPCSEHHYDDTFRLDVSGIGNLPVTCVNKWGQNTSTVDISTLNNLRTNNTEEYDSLHGTTTIQLRKILGVLYLRVIIVFLEANHLSLCQTSWFHTQTSHFISVRYMQIGLLLSSPLRFTDQSQAISYTLCISYLSWGRRPLSSQRVHSAYLTALHVNLLQTKVYYYKTNYSTIILHRVRNCLTVAHWICKSPEKLSSKNADNGDRYIVLQHLFFLNNSCSRNLLRSNLISCNVKTITER